MSRVAAGLTAYVLAILIPFAVALMPPRPDARGLAVELGVALGFVAFAMLAAQFLLTARFPRLAAPYGLDALIRFHPWTVVEVRPEKGRAWTVALDPVGHAGMTFQAGQFAWLALDQPPWDIDVHPYSFSSSAEVAADTGRVEFTIKELGDFTARTGEIAVGTRAHLDGPYGNFVLDDAATGAVFVVGGVGVTPALSILRTMRDRGDDRPAWLVYGAGSPDKVIADAELGELRDAGHLDLTVVVEDAGGDWPGERALITEDLLRRVLPPLDEGNLAVFCCGPDEMMDAVLPALRRLGADRARIRAERFKLA